jgi:peptide-methionine (S)-S-oxide reductase
MMIVAAACAGLLAGMTATAADKVADKAGTKLATFGGGCFWCLEAGFERFEGVKAVVSGYAGGSVHNPTYKQVCEGRTGHAEVVQVQYDPKKISYEQLLEIFWEIHDPTTLNRQGADEGTQYRSVIYFHDDEQHKAALASMKAVAGRFRNPVVTELQPLEKFYEAEDYHQDYFRNNPKAPYCVVVISPKLKKLEKLKLTPPAK